MRLSILLSPTVVSTGVHGLGLALRLLFVLILVRQSSPAVLGYFGLLASIEMISIYFAGFELHTFSTRRYARHTCPTQLRICFGAHLRIFRFSAPLAALAGMGAAWIFDVELDALGFACFGVIAATGTVTQEIGRYLVLMRKPVRSMVMSLLRTAVWMPFVIPLIGTEQESLRAILVAWMLASLLAMSWGLHAVRSALSRHLRMRTKYILYALRRSFNYYAVATASVVQSNVERFVLQVMLGPTAVGIYSLFLTLANTLTALIQAGVLNIFLPRLLVSFGGLQPDRRANLDEAMKRALIVCLIMSAVILAMAVPIVQLTRHADYLHYFWVLPALLLGQTILMWTQPVHLALYGAHHDYLLLGITLSALVVSLAVSAVLIGAAGIAGAAVAPVIVSLAVAYARWRAFRRLEASGLA